jgi:hypothetical protein
MNDQINADSEGELPILNRPARTMIILLVVVLLGGIALYFGNGKGIYTDNILIKNPLESTLRSSDSASGYNLTGGATITSSYSILSPSNQELISSIPGLVTAQTELTDRISSLSTTTESLTRSLTDFIAEMDTTLYTKFQALDQQSINSVEMQSQLTLLNNNLQAVEASILRLKKQVAYTSKKTSKSEKKKKSLPPFKLMSVQIWNSQPIAIVSHQNTRIGIGVNEVLAGWNIDSILQTGCMEVSQHRQSVKLCL